MRHHRQAEVRIDVRVAVPGEMLQRCEHPGVLHAAHPAGDHLACLGRILTERADVDYRIARVVVHVGDRAVVHVHAERARFGADDFARFIRQRGIACGSKRHRARKLRRAGDAHLHAPFEIGRSQQRQVRNRLQPVVDRGQLHRLPEDHRAIGVVQHHLRDRLTAAKGDRAADVRFVNQLDQLLVLVAVAAHVGGLKRRENHLADDLLDRQFPERGVHPRAARLVERGLLTMDGECQHHGADGDGKASKHAQS